MYMARRQGRGPIRTPEISGRPSVFEGLPVLQQAFPYTSARHSPTVLAGRRHALRDRNSRRRQRASPAPQRPMFDDACSAEPDRFDPKAEATQDEFHPFGLGCFSPAPECLGRAIGPGVMSRGGGSGSACWLPPGSQADGPGPFPKGGGAGQLPP